MHYYVFAALIFADGNIRDARNILYRSETPANIVDFRNEVAANHAGPPNTYTGIVISHWQEISEDTFNAIGAEYKRLNEQAMEELQRREV